ncbi:hypothetical protein ACFLQ6_00580 [Thermoproteota archaeon]
MVRFFRLLLPALLVGLLIIGFSEPVMGQVEPPNLLVDPLSITADVSTEFSIDIWITDIPETYRLNEANISVTWLRAAMDRVSEETNQPNGWSVSALVAPWSMPLPPEDWISFDFFPDNGIEVTEDRRWVTITFHCAGPGISTILVESQVEISTGSAAPLFFNLEPVEVTVNQIVTPVGGVSSPVNKLAILTPYIALAGLIAVVSAVYVIKRRKD